MNCILKRKGLIIFYVMVAVLTYALTMRVEALEKNGDTKEAGGVVINF